MEEEEAEVLYEFLENNAGEEVTSGDLRLYSLSEGIEKLGKTRKAAQIFALLGAEGYGDVEIDEKVNSADHKLTLNSELPDYDQLSSDLDPVDLTELSNEVVYRTVRRLATKGVEFYEEEIKYDN